MNQAQGPAPTRISIDPDDTLPMILDEIRHQRGNAIVLDIPDHCPVLLTATEFRTLKETADREGVTLAIHSEDRLRGQLGSMFGIRNVGEAAPTGGNGWRPPPTNLGSPRAFGTWTQDRDDEPAHGERRRRRDRSAAIETNTTPKRRTDDDVGSLEYLNEPAGFWTATNVGRLAGVILLVVLVAVAAAWYYLPGVTVHVVLDQQTITSQLTYAVATDDANLASDIKVRAPAQQGSATGVPFTISVPATGVQRTPDKTASGEVLLRNPGDAAVTVPKGTTLTQFAGPSFTTNEDVSVPAAKDGEAGEAKVAITAAAPGAASNLKGGELTGALPDFGVYFSNRGLPIEGGTDIEVKIVTDDDITTLDQRIDTDLQRAAAQGWATTLGNGQSVVTPSVETANPDYTVDAKAGDTADQVTASGTVDVTGLIYNQRDVDTQVTAYFRDAFATQVPDGYVLDPATIRLGTPQALGEAANNGQYRIEATAVAYAAFGTDQRQALQSDLAGASWSSGRQRVETSGAFQSVRIERSPGFWPARFPQSGDRITIEVERPAPANAPPASPTPAGSGGG